MAPTKAAGALLSIGEVAAETGIPQHVLRYWEGRLPELQPLKRAGGRRFYRPEDVTMVRDVQRLIDQDGFTLDGAAKALRRGTSSFAHTNSRVIAREGGAPVDMVRQLRAIRDRLSRALS